MNAPRRILVALLGAALIAGCSNSATGPGPALTSTQAQAMAGALMQMTQSASTATYDSAASASPAPATLAPGVAAAVVDSLQTHVTFTGSCALGGTVGVDASVTGTFNLQDSTLDMMFGMVETPSSCVVQDPKSGMQFTLDGKPNITADFTLTAAPQTPLTLSGTVSGAVDWKSDSGSGTCPVNLTYNATADPQTQTGTASVQGSICGRSVKTTISST